MKFLGKFKIGDTIRYSVNFHDDLNTTVDPTSPAARHRKPDNTYADLDAPAKLDTKTGWYGGSIDTTGMAVGSHEIRLSGTVDAHEVATVISFVLENNNLDSIESEIRKIKKETGKVVYVNKLTGNDAYNGFTPGTAKLTIAAGVALLVVGDVIIISGTFDEAVSITLAGVTVILTPGTLISSTLGSNVFTVSGSNNIIKFNKCLISSSTSQTLLNVLGGRNTFFDLNLTGNGGNALNIENAFNHFINGLIDGCGNGLYLFASENIFKNIVFTYCDIGLKLEVGTANTFIECHTAYCTKSYEVTVSGIRNTFIRCSQNSGDGAKTDAGTSNTWIDYRIGSQLVAGQSTDEDIEDAANAAATAVGGLNNLSSADIINAVWETSAEAHATLGSFGAKNQKVVPSESLADYKADVSNLAIEANVEGHVTNSLNSYDPPTRAEATADKAEIVEDLDDVKGTGFIKDTNSLVNITGSTPVNLQIGGVEITIEDE